MVDEVAAFADHEGSSSPSSVSAANAAGIFAEGSRFGAYVVGPCIGHGETGRIYRAEHEAIPIELALKVFTDEFSRSAVGRNRFLREARRAATIRHPSVVSIFDVGVQDGIPYLVMERLQGEDLDALLRSRGALDEGTIVDLMVPVVAGLCALHDAAIVHGDLETANIFLALRSGREREPKLLDCGISRALGGDKLRRSSGTRGILRGSPLYLSPEAATGGDVTALSDQYSLGVVMYECAVGANPFVADGAGESVRRILQAEYLPLSTHESRPSEALARIIERAMSPDPEQRYADLKALGRELLMLAGERTRMTWRLSFGDSGALSFARRKPISIFLHLQQAWFQLRDERLRGLDGSTVLAVLVGLVAFWWGISLLMGH
ncbi:MAG: serine/threonine-protein kinase [Deltaproteobacteria bacterium]